MDDPDDWVPITRLHLQAPEPYDKALSSLSENDQERILEAIVRCDDAAMDLNINNGLRVARDQSRTLSDDERLFGDLVAERHLLIHVATGGPRINDVDDYYRVRRKRLHRLLEERGLEDSNPFPSLWDWYKRWSAELASRSISTGVSKRVRGRLVADPLAIRRCDELK